MKCYISQINGFYKGFHKISEFDEIKQVGEVMNENVNSHDRIAIEYASLTQPGNLGFYKSCEVTTVFMINKTSRQAFNYFSIFAFHEGKALKENIEYLTEKPLRVSDEYTLGICRYYLTMEEAYESFNQMRHTQSLINKGGELQIGKLSLINKQFVPQNGTTEVCLNRILKNNFMNGCYIYEFFNNNKKIASNLTKNQLEKISAFILKYVPIDLHVLQDRIGNIIFQFPSNLVTLKSSSSKDGETLNITLNTDDRITDNDRYSILVSNEFDGCLTGTRYHSVKNNQNTILDIGDTDNLIKSRVYDKKSNLVVYEANYSWIKEINTRFHIGSEFSKKRTMNIPEGTVDVEVESVEFLSVPPIKHTEEKYWKEFVKERQYRERLEELERRMKFMQYGTAAHHGRKQALKDIRKLINIHSENQIMLWDPYLTVYDIFDTLYYCKQMGVEMRAITSSSGETRKINGEKDQNITAWIEEQKEVFNTKSNNYGINLQVRCQHTQFGWKFHDRFLLFVKRDGTTLAWSLGTSINSIGKNHHIVQEVSHPQYIVDAFNELWNSLDDERCLLWKSN